MAQTYDKDSFVKLAVDIYKGEIANAQFSKAEAEDKITQAIFDIAGVTGSEMIDVRKLRRNDNLAKVFDIIEEVIPKVSNEGLKGDEFFFDLVDYRNVAEGDMNEFVTLDDSTFIVAEVADGIATPRRQRIGKKSTLTVPTHVYMVRFYEEMSRLLSGRVTWSDFVNELVYAYTQAKYNIIYTAFSGIDAETIGGGDTYYYDGGSYDEDALLEMIAHVEAATGEDATVIGTKLGLHKVTGAELSGEVAKTDMYNLGYYGKFYGTPMVAVKNRHKIGTDEFILDDNTIYVIAAGDKPIKFVTEGNGYIDEKPSSDNADLTQEYIYQEKWGCGLILNQKMGVYKLA